MRIFTFCLILGLAQFGLFAQVDTVEVKNRIGFMIGTGSQRNFPLASRDYIYKSISIRLQLERELWARNKWTYSLVIEPGVFRVDHRLINQFFVKPSTPNFLEVRERFLQPRTFEEYVLNAGFKVVYQILTPWEVYALGSTGPLYSTESTERLKGGLAFSNLLGLGSSVALINQLRIDVRASIRHNSNAGTRLPNSGHNSLLLETGLSYGF